MRITTLQILSVLTIGFASQLVLADSSEGALLKTIEKRAKELAPQLTAACVSLKAESGRWGSGVVVTKSGLIFTAAHTFSGDANEVIRVFQKDQQSMSAELVKLDRSRDIAVLRLKNPGEFNFAPLSFDSVSTDSEAFLAAGHPTGFDPEREAPVRFGLGYRSADNDEIYATCKVNVGDSGGPLFDLAGNVVGIHRTMDAKGKFSAHVPVKAFFSTWPDLAGVSEFNGMAAKTLALR